MIGFLSMSLVFNSAFQVSPLILGLIFPIRLFSFVILNFGLEQELAALCCSLRYGFLSVFGAYICLQSSVVFVVVADSALQSRKCTAAASGLSYKHHTLSS